MVRRAAALARDDPQRRRDPRSRPARQTHPRRHADGAAPRRRRAVGLGDPERLGRALVGVRRYRASARSPAVDAVITIPARRSPSPAARWSRCSGSDPQRVCARCQATWSASGGPLHHLRRDLQPVAALRFGQIVAGTAAIRRFPRADVDVRRLDAHRVEQLSAAPPRVRDGELDPAAVGSKAPEHPLVAHLEERVGAPHGAVDDLLVVDFGDCASGSTRPGRSGRDQRLGLTSDPDRLRAPRSRRPADDRGSRDQRDGSRIAERAASRSSSRSRTGRALRGPAQRRQAVIRCPEGHRVSQLGVWPRAGAPGDPRQGRTAVLAADAVAVSLEDRGTRRTRGDLQRARRRSPCAPTSRDGRGRSVYASGNASSKSLMPQMRRPSLSRHVPKFSVCRSPTASTFGCARKLRAACLPTAAPSGRRWRAERGTRASAICSCLKAMSARTSGTCRPTQAS